VLSDAGTELVEFVGELVDPESAVHSHEEAVEAARREKAALAEPPR